MTLADDPGNNVERNKRVWPDRKCGRRSPMQASRVQQATLPRRNIQNTSPSAVPAAHMRWSCLFLLGGLHRVSDRSQCAQAKTTASNTLEGGRFALSRTSPGADNLSHCAQWLSATSLETRFTDKASATSPPPPPPPYHRDLLV